MGSVFRPSAQRRFGLALAALQCLLLGDNCSKLISDCGRSPSRGYLAESWGSPDEASFRKTLHWLVTEGHQARWPPTPRRDITAWDVGRAVQVARWGYMAGYLNRDEAWSIVEESGARARANYAGWEDYGEAYAVGADYWMLILDQAPIPEFREEANPLDRLSARPA